MYFFNGKKKNLFFVLLLLGISLFFLYLGLNCNFFQNDDWVYRLNVEQFLTGDFSLHPYIGPTFYVQGFLGATWSSVFGLSQIDLLTAVITSINVALFANILLKLKFSFYELVIGILLIAFNPINVYLSIGYMTGQYFMLFFLTSLIFFYEFSELWNPVYLLGMVLGSLLALFTRQVGLIIPLSFAIYAFFKRKFEYGVFGVAWFLLFYVFLEFVFPKTPRMVEVPLQFHHLLDFDYFFSLVYGILIVITAFLLPLFLKLVVGFVVDMVAQKYYFKLGLFLVSSVVLFFVLNHLFNPEAISWGEFPYFENTFERTGFYPRGIHGTKYHMMFNFKIYILWDLASKVLVAASLVILAFNIKRLFEFEFYLILVYIFVLVITETFYDRYIIPLVPMVIFFLFKFFRNKGYSNLKIERIFVYFVGTVFVTFLIFYTYQFSMDFLRVNNYVWEESVNLTKKGIDPNLIYASHAWRFTYPNSKKNPEYFFSYDAPGLNSKLDNYYELEKTQRIGYPLNAFVEPRVYLYKLK